MGLWYHAGAAMSNGGRADFTAVDLLAKREPTRL
jgi:hypothetical protein